MNVLPVLVRQPLFILFSLSFPSFFPFPPLEKPGRGFLWRMFRLPENDPPICIGMLRSSELILFHSLSLKFYQSQYF